MTSWKKYGGKDKFENMNNLTVNTLVCENFVLRKQYLGNWNINGALNVSLDAIVEKNLYVLRDADISGNVIIRGSLVVLGTDVSGNVNVSDDILIRRNIYLGPDSTVKSIISGTNNRIGINKQNTDLYATLDISGNMERTIDIHAYVPNNKNVIARNIGDKGITVNVEPARAYIDFYVDNSMNLTTENRNARILCEPGGILTMDVSSTFRVLPNAIFSKNKTDTALEKEAVTIYDLSSNTAPYLYYYYNDLSYNSGNAVNIVSTDYSSNVFLTLRNRGGAGMAVGGGYLPGNIIMGSLALTDASNVKYSAMNIISGNFNKQIRTAIGVNKHNVVKDVNGINKYAMEINGPVKMGHQEINIAAETTFEILGQCFYDNSGFAFGTPIKEGPNQFNQYLLTTSDGGFTWKKTPFLKILPDNLGTSDINFNAGYSSKTEALYLVGGEQNFLYYSNNYDLSWTSITVVNTFTVNLVSVYLSPNKLRLIIGCFVLANNNYRILNSSGFGNVSTSLGSQIDVELSSISAIDGFDNNYAYIVGGGGIRKLNITNNTYTSIVGTGTYYGIKFYYDGSKYHSIVGGANSIYYSHDVNAGIWTGVSVSGIIRSVYIVDMMRAYAVGDGGTILFSVDGYTTWRKFTYDELNYMGNASRLYNTNLKNVWSRGANDLLITGTITNYDASNSIIGNSYIFDLFSPYFFNHSEYNVLELSGNMVMSGDLNINDEGRLMTNNTSFYMLPENASQIYIGNTVVGGKTNVLNNLDVCGNEIVYGNFLVLKDASMNQNFFVNGHTVLNGDVSMNGNLRLDKDASFNGNLAVLYDVSINRNLYVYRHTVLNGDVSMNGNLRVDKDASFNGNLAVLYDVSINRNLYVYRHTVLNGDVSMNGNLRLEKDASFNGNLAVLYDISINRNLYVYRHTVLNGDVSMNGNLRLEKDASFNGNLAVLYDISINRNLYVYRHTVLNGDVSMNGNLRVDKDASFNGNLAVLYDISINRNLFVYGRAVFNDDVSMNGNLWLDKDASFNGNLAVLYDISINRNLYVYRRSVFNGDVSMNGNLRVDKDASFNGNLAVLYDISINRNLYVYGHTVLNDDVSMNGNLRVDKDASFNGNLAVLYDISINRNLYVTGVSKFMSDVSMAVNLDVSENITALQMALGKKTITNGYTLDISGNVNIRNGFIHQW